MREVYEPYAHQVEADDFIKELKSWALFMEQGTGKSKVVLMKAKRLYEEGLIDRLLVICPSALKNQWQGEVLDDHCPMEYKSLAWDGFTAKWKQAKFNKLLVFEGFKVLSMNYEAFLPNSKALDYVRFYLKDEKALIVCDESTKIKNPDAQRTKKIVSGFKNRPYKGILTGTPTPNSPFDLWSQFNFLKPDYFRMSYHHFKRHYCIMVKKMNPSTGRPFNAPIDDVLWTRCKKLLEKELNLEQPEMLAYEKVAVKIDISVRDAMVISKQKSYSPYKNLDELWKLIDPLTFKVMKRDCLDLPDKIYSKLEVEMTAEQKRTIKQLRKDLMTEYEGDVLTASNILSLTCRLQMITGGIFPYQKSYVNEEGEIIQNTEYKLMKENPKLKALTEDLETVHEETQVIIWACFVGELELIYKQLKKLGHSTEIYYGKTPIRKRAKIIEGFRNNEFRILVINPSLGEMGLNLQNCNLHYFFSSSYNAERRLQAEDRSHRIGQKNNVTYKDIHCINSIDQKIYTIVKRKESLIDFFRNKKLVDLFDEENKSE